MTTVSISLLLRLPALAASLIFAGAVEMAGDVPTPNAPAPVRQMEGHSEPVLCVVFSRDGRQLASGGADRTIRLWDVESGKLLHTFEGHTERVNSVGFSPDGTLLVSGSDDRSARVWDIKTGQLIALLEGHHGAVHCVTFHPDGRHVLTGCCDHSLRIWDVKDERVTKTIEHQDCVIAVVLTADGSRIATSTHRSAAMFDLKTGKELSSWDVVPKDNDEVTSADLSADGARLLVSTMNDGLRLWDTSTQKEMIHITRKEGSLFAVRSVRLVNGKETAVVAGVTEATGYDLKTGELVLTLNPKWQAVPNAIAVSPDAHWAVTGGETGTSNRPPIPGCALYLWDLKLALAKKNPERK